MDIHAVIGEAKRLQSIGAHDESWRFLVANGEAVPSNLDTCMLGISALQKMGRIEEALSRAITWQKNGRPNNLYILRVCGLLLHTLGREKEALSYLIKAEQLSTDPYIAAKIVDIRGNLQASRLFTDWSDLIALSLFFVHITVAIVFLILPYWQDITLHPAWRTLKIAIELLGAVKLSTHAWWLIAVVILTVIAGMFLQGHESKKQTDTVVDYSGIRRVWSYHLHWLVFVLAVAGSLYTNSESFSFSLFNKEFISMILGMFALASGVSCLYLFIPGARTRIQLLRTATNRGNRLIITKGVIFKSTQTCLPQMVDIAQIRNGPMWILTFTGCVDVSLTNGEIIRLIAPGSFLETRILPSKINTAMNEAKIIGSHSSEKINKGK